jgi:glutathione S-transferase
LCGTLPTLEDNGEIIWDSHAINKYLVLKYGKDDRLYPDDLLLRARIDQRMFFDASYLFPRGFQIMVPVIFMGSSKFTDEQKDQILMGYTLLEQFLESGTYLVGDKMTLADLSCCPLMESSRRILAIDEDKFPKLCAWLKRLADELPYYQELCVAGAEYHADLFNKALERNKSSSSVL